MDRAWQIVLAKHHPTLGDLQQIRLKVMFNIPKKVQKGTLNYSTNPWQMEKNSVKLWYMNGMFSWPTKIQKNSSCWPFNMNLSIRVWLYPRVWLLLLLNKWISSIKHLDLSIQSIRISPAKHGPWFLDFTIFHQDFFHQPKPKKSRPATLGGSVAPRGASFRMVTKDEVSHTSPGPNCRIADGGRALGPWGHGPTRVSSLEKTPVFATFKIYPSNESTKMRWHNLNQHFHPSQRNLEKNIVTQQRPAKRNILRHHNRLPMGNKGHGPLQHPFSSWVFFIYPNLSHSTPQFLWVLLRFPNLQWLNSVESSFLNSNSF